MHAISRVSPLRRSAASNHQADAVRALLAARADPLRTDRRGKRASGYATGSRSCEAMLEHAEVAARAAAEAELAADAAADAAAHAAAAEAGRGRIDRKGASRTSAAAGAGIVPRGIVPAVARALSMMRLSAVRRGARSVTVVER